VIVIDNKNASTLLAFVMVNIDINLRKLPLRFTGPILFTSASK
jgi:hypothetical protein